MHVSPRNPLHRSRRWRFGNTGGERERALRVERKGDLRLRGKEGDEQEKDYGVPISLTEAYA